MPLDARGTAFEQRVWTASATIPAGADCKLRRGGSAGVRNGNASRAVGLANGANPIAIIVPCHRVIGSDGSLTGYGGGLDRKQWLLEHEAARSGPTDPAVAGLAVCPACSPTKDDTQPRVRVLTRGP